MCSHHLGVAEASEKIPCEDVAKVRSAAMFAVSFAVALGAVPFAYLPRRRPMRKAIKANLKQCLPRLHLLMNYDEVNL